MAVGIAGACSGDESSLALLQPLLSDPVDFVRQGAYIASSFLLQQYNDDMCSDLNDKYSVAALRKKLKSVVADRHDDVMARMGAVLATSMLDAGGRNSCISIVSSGGTRRTTGVVGLALFVHSWFWYPLLPCVGLCLTPAALLGVDSELRMPKFDIECSSKKDFSYPPKTKVGDDDDKEPEVKAVLSITVKDAARRAKKAAEKDGMDVEEAKDGQPAKDKEGSDTKEGASTDEAKKDGVAAKLCNPCRVLPAQASYMSIHGTERYSAIKEKLQGIVVLKDGSPELDVDEVVATVSAEQGGEAPVEEEPGPPEPFRYESEGESEDDKPEEKGEDGAAGGSGGDAMEGVEPSA